MLYLIAPGSPKDTHGANIHRTPQCSSEQALSAPAAHAETEAGWQPVPGVLSQHNGAQPPAAGWDRPCSNGEPHSVSLLPESPTDLLGSHPLPPCLQTSIAAISFHSPLSPQTTEEHHAVGVLSSGAGTAGEEGCAGTRRLVAQSQGETTHASPRSLWPQLPP